ncbi:hypothetical protein ULF88_10265 [Halopseudomonas pachastrellae]|nr:hypothetical protein [Halopseudomonas pachastrellae]
MKCLATLGLGVCLLWLSGCSSVGYLYQSWQGQRALMARAEPIDQVIADPQTDPQWPNGCAPPARFAITR